MAVKKVETKRMGNFDMAAAGDRIKAFWEKYPNGKIQTERSRDPNENNLLVFRTFIWKDKKDVLEVIKVANITNDSILGSSDVTGTARQQEGKENKKDFEKLETISVGRALANLGFLKDGQVASTEEMEEFLDYKDNKYEESVETAIEFLKDADSLDDLKKRWGQIDRAAQQDPRVEQTKNNLKKELNKPKVS